MATDKINVLEEHQKNIYLIAGKMLKTKEFESDEFKIKLPKETAALETFPYGEAESLLVKANDNHAQIQTYLSQATAARAFFRRHIDMKEKLLLGDPVLQDGTKNKEQREFNMAKNEEYLRLFQDLRTAETVVAYLEHAAAAASETLQVVKKIRDAALSRQNWAYSQRNA